jgi:predicted aldo/keto reductase-like oxidoreductase
MMSQHINTIEVFEAAIESDLFDSIQIPLNPTVPRDYFTKDEFARKASQDEYLSLIKRAADKGIAITAMKVFLYGPKYWDEVPDLRERVKNYLPDDGSIATALIHWALNVPGITAFGNMLLTFDQLQENLTAIGGKLDNNEDSGLKKFTHLIGSSTCRLCGACEKVYPEGIAVADILRLYGYSASTPSMARNLYATLPKHRRIDAIKNLKIYESSCPYGIPVAHLLRKAQVKLT